MPQSVLDSYDLIGMDTRGVGHSSPISCGFTRRPALLRRPVPPYAYDQAAFDEQVRTAKRSRAPVRRRGRRPAAPREHRENGAGPRPRPSCSRRGHRELPRLLLRLGAGRGLCVDVPESTDRIVLDSNIGDTILDRAGMRRYSRGMEGHLPGSSPGGWPSVTTDYGLWCDRGRGAGDVLRHRLQARCHARERGSTVARSVWPPSSRCTTATYEYCGRCVGLVPGRPRGGSGVGTFRRGLRYRRPGDNSWSVFLAVTCNDVEWPHDVTTYEECRRHRRVDYPLFGAAAARTSCRARSGPMPRPNPRSPSTPTGPTNILIAQHRRDPVTPCAAVELLDERFGDRSRLLTVDGSGQRCLRTRNQPLRAGGGHRLSSSTAPCRRRTPSVLGRRSEHR